MQSVNSAWRYDATTIHPFLMRGLELAASFSLMNIHPTGIIKSRRENTIPWWMRGAGYFGKRETRVMYSLRARVDLPILMMTGFWYSTCSGWSFTIIFQLPEHRAKSIWRRTHALSFACAIWHLKRWWWWDSWLERQDSIDFATEISRPTGSSCGVGEPYQAFTWK